VIPVDQGGRERRATVYIFYICVTVVYNLYSISMPIWTRGKKHADLSKESVGSNQAWTSFVRRCRIVLLPMFIFGKRNGLKIHCHSDSFVCWRRSECYNVTSDAHWWVTWSSRHSLCRRHATSRSVTPNQKQFIVASVQNIKLNIAGRSQFDVFSIAEILFHAIMSSISRQIAENFVQFRSELADISPMLE